MDTVNREDVLQLADARQTPAISLFMPTHRGGPDIREDPVRLKNLIGRVERELEAQGLAASRIQALLEPLRAKVEDMDFWRHQDAGLALFRHPDLFRWYRVPVPQQELAVVGERFHLTPLLPALHDRRFYILALSQNQVRFLGADNRHVWPEALPNTPGSLAEAQRHTDYQLEGPRQRQNQRRVGSFSEATMHSHSATEIREKQEVQDFFRQVDKGVQRALNGRSEPLVLVAVDYEVSLYREVNSYPHLLGEALTRNPDRAPEHELHREALAVVRPHFERDGAEARRRFAASLGTGQGAHRLEEVVRAAHEGAVEALLVAEGEQRWGRFDPAGFTSEVHPERQPGDEDLLDRAATQTLRQQGAVHLLPPGDMPPEAEGSPIAAVFRYPRKR